MRLFERTDIYGSDGSLYLTRWHVFPRRNRKRPERKGSFAVKVHRIARSDLDRHLHNHPWGFVTVLLKGSYFEERLLSDGVAGKHYRAGNILWRRPNDFHKLTLNSPVWTLVFVGRKCQSWGFFVDGSVVPFDEYVE